MAPLSLLTVHAHPDDESSKGAGTVARYTAEGVRTTLVCCTGGELGDIVNPALVGTISPDDLPAVRAAELAEATRLIGFTEVVQLGYRDSGMAGSVGNEDPRSFHQADKDEAVARLVAEMRRLRPQVIITYGDDQQGYPHPDHLAVHDISLPAFERSGDHSYRPDLGGAWQPLKLYYSAWSRARITAMHERYLAMGLTSPYDAGWFERPSHDHRITTRIDVRDFYAIRSQALRAHATQIDATSPFWFGLPDEVAADAYPWEDFILARHHLAPGSLASPVPSESESGGAESGDGVMAAWENDLFAGVR